MNPSDDLPLYRQIMRQITEAIAGDRLRPGDKLLSHRDLAEQLVIAPLTVKKAYDELEGEGLIETQRGRGTFISERARVNRNAQRERLKETARRMLSQAYVSGFTYKDALDVLKEADRQIQSGRHTGKERPE